MNMEGWRMLWNYLGFGCGLRVLRTFDTISQK